MLDGCEAHGVTAAEVAKRWVAAEAMDRLDGLIVACWCCWAPALAPSEEAVAGLRGVMVVPMTKCSRCSVDAA